MVLFSCSTVTFARAHCCECCGIRYFVIIRIAYTLIIGHCTFLTLIVRVPQLTNEKSLVGCSVLVASLAFCIRLVFLSLLFKWIPIFS